MAIREVIGVRRLAVIILLLGVTVPLTAVEPLTMTVTPAAAMSPTNVRIRLHVEPDARNRALEVVTDGSNFYRSSIIDLAGDPGTRTFVFEYHDIRAGTYVVSATLSDRAGHVLAAKSREIVVIPTGS